MPLNTQIVRDEEELSIRWSQFHIAAMTLASALDGESQLTDMLKMTDPKLEDAARSDEGLTLTSGAVFAVVSYPVIGASPLNSNHYEIKNGPYTFVDATDEEVFTLQTGDVLKAWRN